MINLTPNALSAVEKFIKSSDVPVAGLRIAVAGGGCSGFQYGMSLEQAKNEDDMVVEFGALTLQGIQQKLMEELKEFIKIVPTKAGALSRASCHP